LQSTDNLTLDLHAKVDGAMRPHPQRALWPPALRLGYVLKETHHFRALLHLDQSDNLDAGAGAPPQR